MTADGKIEIMIASSVYGYEDQLNQICGLFEQMGYHPVNSHYKTMPTDPTKSNLDNCIEAVNNCDVLFGVLRPFYGSGVIGDTSITHEEMKRAIELKKPRWFVAHRDIRVARVLLKQYRFLPNGDPNPDFAYARTKLMDDIRVINMYDDTIQNDIPPEERIGHWTDEFFDLNDIKKVIQTQFTDIDRIQGIIDKMNDL
ncbi:DUF4062 domain-containing protein [Nonlabens tegetincola]|uniref:DUF4062 domain-containing protein n=1 Tax=Nonlabens tegetincola TaxID=323273 RepID=UPI000CF3A96A|nr:DUF4062 domain-containing protein [Nonlabens tegetincola]PQJ17029.1 hypothetical protein BST93_10170 [Nonlabens tegetincola]